MAAVKESVKTQEIFSALLKAAAPVNFVGGELTLEFKGKHKAAHFEKRYKQRFEEAAERIFGEKFSVRVVDRE